MLKAKWATEEAEFPVGFSHGLRYFGVLVEGGRRGVVFVSCSDKS